MRKISKIIFLTLSFLFLGKLDFAIGVCDQRFGEHAEKAALEVLGCEEVKIGNRIVKTKDIILAEIAHESCCGNPKCGSFRRLIHYNGKDKSYIENLCKKLGRDPASWDLDKTCVVTFDGGMGWAQYMSYTWEDLIVKRGYGAKYGVKDPWNDRDAAYLVAIHLKAKSAKEGFCQNPVVSIMKYNGDGLAYVYEVVSKIGQKIKEVIGEIMGAIEKEYMRIWKEYTRLELEYPEIFGLKPKEVKIGLEFFKYIYLFVIWSLGFLLFIVLLYYGILWYTAGANIEQALRAKQRIIQAFFGAILLLGSWILLEILSPQFTKIQKEIPPPQEIKTLPEVTKKEGEKIIIAKGPIPLNDLINKSRLISQNNVAANSISTKPYSQISGIEFGLGEQPGFTRDNIPNSDASYNWNQAFVSDREREQIKRDSENFVNKVSDEEQRRQYKTTIREVRAVVNTVLKECELECPQLLKNYNDCVSECSSKCSSGDSGDSECLKNCSQGCDSLKTQYERCVEECAKIRELKNKADNFPSNSEYSPVVGDLEEKRNSVNRVEEEFELPPGDYSHYKDEEYGCKCPKAKERAKKAIEEILNLSRSINCANCPEISTICEKMKSTVEDFAKGWEIRELGWQIITEAQQISEKQAQYINLLEENLKFGTDYLYEGTVAPTKIERILGINQVLRIKSDYAKNLALTIEALSAAITALLVGGCHCFECVGCGACGGDACVVVRPLLSALQVALGVSIVAMPPVAQQVQKEIDKEQREKEELKKSLEELTEGLALAEREIFTCRGVTKRGEFKQLFSALEFLNYKSAVEKMGYKVIVQELWPNIKPEGDPFTFYCVTGPLVELISDTQDPNNLKDLKLYCDQSTESEVGELIDKIKEVIKGQEQILDQKDKEIKNAQKLVNEMRRNQEKLENGEKLEQWLENAKITLPQGGINELLEKGIENIKVEFPKELENLGEKLKNISGKQFAEMIGKLPEKYAKQAIGYILENISGKDAKDFFVKAFKEMKEEDFKEMFNKYLSSMMDENVKKFSHAFLEAIPERNLKEILISGFNSFSEKDLKDFWKNSLKNFNDGQKAVFFSTYFRDAKEEQIERFFGYSVQYLSEIENKQMLKEMLEVSDQNTVEKILENYIKSIETGKTISPDKLNLEVVISNIPSQEIKSVLSNTKKILTEKNLFRKAIRNVSPEIFESTISKIPEDKIKGFTEEFYKGIEEFDIKDFVLENILDGDPTFFQKFTQNLPPPTMKSLMVKLGFESLSDSFAKEIFLLMHELPDRDPRRILNHLFLKYLPLNRDPDEDRRRLSSAMNILKAGGIFDQFLGEAASVFNFNPQWNLWGKIVKDIGDKIHSFTFELKKVTNDILDQIPLYPDDAKKDIWKLALFTQDSFIQTPNLSVRDILGEINKKIPENILFDSTKEFLKSISSEELRNISKEILSELSVVNLKNTFESIVDGLPKEEILTALAGMSQSVSLEDLKNSLDKLPSESKIEIFKHFIYPYYLSEEERKDWIGKDLSEQDWKSFLNRVQSKEIIYTALSYLPERDLKNILKDYLPKISKEDLIPVLSKLPSVVSDTDNVYKFLNELPSESLQKIILNAFPEHELKNFSDTLFKSIATKLPLDEAKKLLREALNKDLALFQNTVNNLFSQLLNKIPTDILNKLVNQILSALPTQKLVELFTQIISQLPSQFLNSILGQLQTLLGPLFSLLFGGPGLKQNAIAMLKYPTEYLTACVRCCKSPCKKHPPPCAGVPGPLISCSPTPVLRRLALITINVGRIILFKELLDKALDTEENLIEEKIKNDIWPEANYSSKNFASTPCFTIAPGREGYLVKCEDALKYGWVGKCDHKFNFVCCRKK